MTRNELTLEQVAELVNGKLWEKNGIKRVYVKEGYNTKKMSTTTYIYKDAEGELKVSCFIECNSQPYNWINAEKNKVVNKVLDLIDCLLNPEIEEELV